MKIINILLALALLLLIADAQAQTTISLNIADGPGEGFNDPSPVAPVGGNPATTLGGQRQFVFERAAEIWGGLLNSNIEIVISAQFNPQACDEDGITLGSASPTSVFADFPNTPIFNRFYPVALANALANEDLNGFDAEISTTFNSELDNDCAFSNGFYYGIDGNPPPGFAELLPVALHEIGHGLGFTTFVNPDTGEFLGGIPDIWSNFLTDLDLNQTWSNLNDIQRSASATNDPNLVWNGPSVNAAFPSVLVGQPQLTINTPNTISADIFATPAAFGPSVISAGINGQIVLAEDGIGPDANDGCSPLSNPAAINGNIALIRRGQCNFTVKTINAQNSGAVAVVIVNNPGNTPLPFALGGEDPSIFIPTIGIEQAPGDTIESTLLNQQVVNITINVDQSSFAGTSQGFIRMNAPDPVEPGSSLAHWTPQTFPNLLMEPAINANLFETVDLTLNLLEDIGWSVNFPEAVSNVSALNPAGVYTNQLDDQSTETVLIRALDAENQFSVANFEGNGLIVSIDDSGQVSNATFGLLGSFSDANNAQFNANGTAFAFNLQRVATTDSDFLDFSGQPFPINPLYEDTWTVTQNTLDPSTGAFSNTTTFNIALSAISQSDGSSALRTTQFSPLGFPSSFSQGSLESQRDFVIQVGPGADSLALQTLPGNDFSQALNGVGRGRFTNINTFTQLSVLENQPNTPPLLEQDQLVIQQIFNRADPILPGDFNGDGSIQDSDRNAITDLYGLNEQDTNYNLLADIDNNGVIDLRDSALLDGQATALMPINDGHAGSWFNTERSGEGWNVSILPGGDLALINFFSYGPDGSTQAWVVGVGDIVGNEIQFRDLDLTSGTAFGDAFDPNDVIRSQWGDLSLHFIDCMNGEISYSATADFGNDARPIQRLTALAGVDCNQPGIPQTAEASQVVTGSWFDLARDGEGLVMEGLSNNLVVLYFYTYDLEGGTQYWLNGVGNFDPATNTATFDTLFTTTGGQFGDSFDADSINLIPWGSATFQQTGCGSAVFSYDSIIEGFGSNSYNVGRISFNNGISCNPDQFSP